MKKLIRYLYWNIRFFWRYKWHPKAWKLHSTWEQIHGENIHLNISAKKFMKLTGKYTREKLGGLLKD